MSDKLITRNGESVEIDSVIEALEAVADKEELLQVLKYLRRDKVKNALGTTVLSSPFRAKAPRTLSVRPHQLPEEDLQEAVNLDQGSPFPVMSEDEHHTIIEALGQKAHAAGKMMSVQRAAAG